MRARSIPRAANFPPTETQCSSAICDARHTCARGISNTTAGIRCEQFGKVPPCINGGGRFFDVPLSEVPLEPPGTKRPAGTTSPPEHRRLAQCYARKRDEDWWMSYDPHARLTRTRSVSDVARLLGERVVTLVGASDVAHLLRAVECHLARHELHDATSCRWRQWGWANLGSARQIKPSILAHAELLQSIAVPAYALVARRAGRSGQLCM